MCQIDWEDRLANFCDEAKPRHKNSSSLFYCVSLTQNKEKNKGKISTIAAFLGLQVASLFIVPSAIFAEVQSLQSVREDTPEEVLRTEIYTDARSPIDGTQLSAAEYAELMEKLRSLDNIPAEDLVSPKVREVIDLLKLRKFLRQFIPFIP